MSLCAGCTAGNHQHDSYTHDGTDAGCPNLAGDHQHPDDGCPCPFRRPPVRVHRCECGHVHQRIAQ